MSRAEAYVVALILMNDVLDFLISAMLAIGLILAGRRINALAARVRALESGAIDRDRRLKRRTNDLN